MRDPQCKTCRNLTSKKWRDDNREKHLAWLRKQRRENPERILSNKMKCTYGITLEQYNQKLKDQGGVCAICKQPESQCGHGSHTAFRHPQKNRRAQTGRTGTSTLSADGAGPATAGT